MLKMCMSACIDAPVQKTWSVLADIENIPLWAESVLSAQCTGRINRGVGAERVCKLKGGIEIRETWVDWQEGQSFTYIGYNLPIVKSAKNRWSVMEDNGKSRLTSESEAVFKGGIFGVFLERLMRIVTAKMAADSLAAFKYLVENGKPFKGKHSLLPRVSPIC